MNHTKIQSQVTMSDNPLVKISKEQAAALKYVQQAASEDQGRPTLTPVRVNGSLEACDGIRIHAANIQLPEALEGLMFVEKVQPTLESWKVIDCNYPDLVAIMPKNAPTVTVTFNAEYMREALTGLTGMCELRIFTEHTPIEVAGHLPDDTATYALVMPMRKDETRNDFSWKPSK
jgi:hypothetical protein